MGLFALALARRADTASWAGPGAPGALLLLLAGWSLIAAGLPMLGRPAGRAAGVLLVAGGFAWFVGDWNNQYAGAATVFTAGLVFSTAGPVLIVHALLRYDGQRLNLLGRLAVTVGYLSTVVIDGIIPAYFFAPQRQGCAGCPANALARESDPGLVEAFGRAGVLAGPIWCLLLALAIGVGLVRASPGRRRLDAWVLGPGIGYLVTVFATYRASSGASYLVVDGTTRPWWAVSGLLLVVIALGTRWPYVQRRRTRALVARLVVDAAAAPPVGGLSSLLSRSLRDPSFRVLYRLGEDGLVDAAGCTAAAADGQAVTLVVRGGETVAVLAHRPGLLDDPALAGEISAAARLVLDNERLQAQTRAQLADLRASRARIVQSGDAERRRLERDLHDGAQQQLVALSLGLQLAALRAADADEAARLDQARTEVGMVLAQLRQLARGLYPRELADEGLSAALETLAEGSAEPVRIDAVPARRFPGAVEAAAYYVVAQLSRTGGGAGVRVAAVADDDHLTVAVATMAPPGDLVALEDRVGALGGRLWLERTVSGDTAIRAVLPCGS